MSVTYIGLGFLEGLALIASPCILPVLPIVLSTSLEGSQWRPYGIIMGFIVAFTGFTLGSHQLVVSLGIDPGVIRQTSFVLLIVFALILLSTRLSDWFARVTQSFGQWGSQLNRQVHTPNEFGTGLLIGSGIGLIWVPCSGPILAVVLVQSIQQHTSLMGVLTVLAFALGAGVPMLVLALGGNHLMKHTHVFNQYGQWIRKATGAIILLTVLVTAQDTFSPLSGLAKPTTNASVPTQLVDGLERPYAAPALVGIQDWVNSKPLTMSGLKGKVVLIDFWTYSCINCLRTLPYIKRWDDKYRQDGLVIIGVHAPEFEFERKLANVQQAVKTHGIHYPVALDSNLKTWQNFNNQYWPAHYLIDKKGRVVYTHFGEGAYDVTEKNIQYLLGVKGSVAQAKSSFNSLQSPETYLGYERMASFNSPESPRNGQAATYTYPGFLGLNQWALKGSWVVKPQHIQAQKANAALQFNFLAKQVYLVLGTATGKPIPVTVSLNGKVVGKPITVSQHRLYTLLTLPKAQNGLVELRTSAPGLQAYAFTFGS